MESETLVGRTTELCSTCYEWRGRAVRFKTQGSPVEGVVSLYTDTHLFVNVDGCPMPVSVSKKHKSLEVIV